MTRHKVIVEGEGWLLFVLFFPTEMPLRDNAVKELQPRKDDV